MMEYGIIIIFVIFIIWNKANLSLMLKYYWDIRPNIVIYYYKIHFQFKLPIKVEIFAFDTFIAKIKS